MLSKINRRGLTIIEMTVALFITGFFLLSIPPLINSINTSSLEAVQTTKSSVQQHTAINSLIKDIKSSEEVTISPDGQSITLKRSATESGILYTLANGKLFLNNDIVLDNVESGLFSADGTVISVDINVQDQLPIQLMLRRPSLKSIVDDGNVVVPPDYEQSGTGLEVNGREVTSTMTISIPVVEEFDVDLATIDPMARIVYYQINGGERQEVRGSSVLFQTTGKLDPVTLTIKVVAENSIDMQIYNITLAPESGDANRIPDWLWGGDEAFRTLFRRKFGVSDLSNLTFGQVRAMSGNLDFSEYRITEIGYIAGEFKAIQDMNFTGCRIYEIPDNFGVNMRQLRNVNFSDCLNLDYSDFQANVSNNAWKTLNCPNINVTWP